jgi:hypothetical protein
MSFIMKRDIDGTVAYFCKFDTPRKQRIKGRKEWTLNIAYAQHYDENAWTPDEITKHARAAGMIVSVEVVN